MLRNLLTTALLLILCTPPSVMAAYVTPKSATAPLVTAFARNGWVYGLRSDGSTVRLTAGTNALDPVLSPDRSRIAYFTAMRGHTDHYSRSILRGIWTVGTRANPQTLVANLQGTGSGALAWSPNGHWLAYVYRNAVALWAGRGSAPRVVARFGSRHDLGFQPVIAWSRDSSKLAVPLPPASLKQIPHNLSIVIVGVSRSPSKRIKVRFPQDLMGSRTTALGSHPTPDQIAWSADGSRLLMATVVNGAGNSLTGIWSVSKGGGMARLVIGNRVGLATRLVDQRLVNATHFLVSPDWRHLVTDPNGRFWVAAINGTQGHMLPSRRPAACALAQFTWLTGGNGLAYVTLCSVGGTPDFRSTLYTVRLQTNRSQKIVSVVSAEMDAVSLAPPVRCAACG
ncbi:MAG TPA: hypothetical protein VF898_12335 [Chloroflexota bacterium]